jgi:cytidine deaminase
MTDALNDELIASAAAALNPRTVGDRMFGDVGCTLVTAAGHRYSGVCIDTGSGTGFCAEHAVGGDCPPLQRRRSHAVQLLSRR